MSDPFDLLADLDEPRPLPTALRERLAAALLRDGAARPLDADLAARLTNRMTDPVAELMTGLDAPRPLSPAMRTALGHSLQRRPRRVWAAAAGVAVVASAAAVLLVSRTPAGDQLTADSRPSPSPSAAASPTAAAPGSASGSGNAAGALPPPAAVQPAAPPVPTVAGPTAASGSAGVAAAPAQGSAAQPLTTVSPDAGPLRGGTTVRLRGPGLRTAQSVSFGTAAATDLQVHADGSVTVRTPASTAAGPVPVVVRRRDGSEVSRDGGFTYVAAPRLDSATPSTGPAAGGTWVTLDGSALGRTTAVRFGDVASPEVRVLSPTRVQARSPVHTAGPVDITVTTPGGTSNGVRYLYLP